jgi:putative transcriptional regulator
MEIKKGDILLAEPFMRDPHFKRTAVLLCEHNEDGSFGLVLNRRLDFKVDHVLPEFPAEDIDLYYGGPVSPDTLHFIHSYGDLIEGSIALNKDVYWSGNFEQVKLMLETGSVSTDRFRFFVGYSGWSAGQLNDEMEINSWIISRTYGNIFVADDEELWKNILRDMGGEYRFVSTFPEDPQLN